MFFHFGFLSNELRSFWFMTQITQQKMNDLVRRNDEKKIGMGSDRRTFVDPVLIQLWADPTPADYYYII